MFAPNITNTNTFPTSLSTLGKSYEGLRPTSSQAFSISHKLEPPPAIHEVAPLQPSDVDALVETLLACPTGKYALRVFQQHEEAGLCWQDSFFILLYNQDWYRPILNEHLRFHLQQFFQTGNTDLTYATVGVMQTPNWNGPLSPTGFPLQKKEVSIRILSEKLKPIAEAFKQHYATFGLPLAFWEFYCLSLHRYILLGYLFVQYEGSIENTHPNKPSQLARRRRSIAAANYTRLHVDFKEYVLRMIFTGIFCENFKKLSIWLSKYITAVSQGEFEFIKYDSIRPDQQITGYYLWIHLHVVSMFTCGGTWYLYDNTVGCIPFSKEDTAHLNSSHIKDILFQKEQNTELYTYSLYLTNDSTVSVSAPLIAQNVRPQKGFSGYVLAKVSKPNGGTRRVRKTRTVKRKRRL